MEILRQNRPIWPIPKFIDYWPEKQVHRYVTCRKEIREPGLNAIVKAQLQADMDNWVKEEEEKGEQLHDRLDELSLSLIGTEDQPKEWEPITEEAERFWELEAYFEYQNTRFLYHLHLSKGSRELTERRDLGRQLLLIADRQTQRVKRLGRRHLLKRERFGEILNWMIGQEGDIPPLEDVISDAWAQYEVDGFYVYHSPNGAEDRTIKLSESASDEEDEAPEESQINPVTNNPLPLE